MIMLSCSEVSTLLGCSLATVSRKIVSGKLQASKISGTYEIALESLPQEAQDRYWAQVRAEQDALGQRNGKAARAAKRAKAQADAEEAQIVEANEAYNDTPAWQKDIIDERLYIVTQTAHMAMAQALEWCKEKSYKVSRGTLYRWRAAFEEGGKNALASGYGNRTGMSSVPAAAFKVYRDAYMTQAQLSSEQAYQQAVGYMVLHTPNLKVPSRKAFEYLFRQRQTESEVYYARHGESAWNRKYGYSIDADYDASWCGETAVSDHMQLDIMVIDPATGKPVRPWLTAWCDWKSRKLLAWDVHIAAPNSDHIFTSFHAMCSDYGLPQNILIDNGKDYRCKDFAGGRNVTRKVKLGLNQERTTSLMEDLGVKPFFALPYNAQRKNIERLFKDFHNAFERHFRGYTGTNIAKRPEAIKKQIKEGTLMSFDDLKRIVDDFIVNVFNRRIFSRTAVHAGKSPNQVWEEENPVLRRADSRALAVFLQRTSEKLRVTKNGVRDPQLKDRDIYYWAEEMIALVGSYVYLRRDPRTYGTAWVYAAGDDRKLLCMATIKGTVDPFADSEASKEELKKQIARKRQVTKAVRAAAAVEDDSTIDDKLERLKAAADYADAQRGYVPEPNPSTIEMQYTPLDGVAREQERYLKEATNNAPIPVLTAPKKRKIYFSRTEMECDLGGSK